MRATETAVLSALGFTILLATGAAWQACMARHPGQMFQFGFYLAAVVLAAQLDVRLPGRCRRLTANFVFALMAIVELRLEQALVVAAAGTAATLVWGSDTLESREAILWRTVSGAITTGLAYTACRLPGIPGKDFSGPLQLGLAACGFYLTDQATQFALAGHPLKRRAATVWGRKVLETVPNCLAAAALVSVWHAANERFGWEVTALHLPALYLTYRAVQLFSRRSAARIARRNRESSLHWSTIEALAVAVEAKDGNTHGHLRRVRLYAAELGRALGLSGRELEALEIAALLHDVGKLGIPEQILSKPGRLTPAEFETMKTHALIGAEILERVGLPHPVVPIVRAHHEKWDGSGYPLGLRRGEIPIGARILAAVDCLDAMASPRQYRRAIPIQQAMRHIESEAGHSFDPEVVEALRQRYAEIEAKVRALAVSSAPTGSGEYGNTGTSPGTGYEVDEGREGDASESPAVKEEIEHLRSDLQSVTSLAGELSDSLALDFMLPLAAAPVERSISHDLLVIYVLCGSRLMPEYVRGSGAASLESLEIPLGDGISGWVALSRKPIINGDPAMEANGDAAAELMYMESALSVPLEGRLGLIGVMTLFHTEPDHFTRRHVRLALAAAGDVARVVELAARGKGTAGAAGIDTETDLPDSESLGIHLEKEIARCRREGTSLAVIEFTLESADDPGLPGNGRQIGRALWETGRRLAQSCRQYDYVARVGRRSLALVLPGSPADAARRRATELSGAACPDGLPDLPGMGLRASVVMFPDDGQDAAEVLAAFHSPRRKNASGWVDRPAGPRR